MYEALKPIIKEEERSSERSDSGDSEAVGLPDEKYVAHAEGGGQYDGTRGEGVDKTTLSTCVENPTEDKDRIGEATIAGLE